MAATRWGPCHGCGAQIQSPRMHRDSHYCGLPCMHDAGCRWVCCELDVCGCTSYAKRRRVLRETRDAMRVMAGVLVDNGLLEAYEEELDETSLPEVDLAADQGPGGADETSDHEDVEATLRATVAERSEADMLHQLAETAASLSERSQLRAENARLRALLDRRS